MAELIVTPLTVVHVIACTFLILVVLLQPGKSGGLGAFSGAAAQQVFGGRGAGNFLTKTTWIIASVFLMTSISLAYLSSTSDDSLEDLATELQDAAHANKAPESAVKLAAKPTSKPGADPEAIKRALQSLTLDARVAEQPKDVPAPGGGEATKDSAVGASKPVSPTREADGATEPAKAVGAGATRLAPGAQKLGAQTPTAPVVPAAPRLATSPAQPAAPTAPAPPAQPAAPAAPPAQPAVPVPAAPAVPPPAP